MRSRINSAARDTISTHLVETAMEIPWDSIKHIALIAWCIKVQFSCKGHNQHSPGRDCRGDPKRQHEAHSIDCLVPCMRSRFNSAARDTTSTHLVETAVEIPRDSIKHMALVVW